jgi:hypothetical protein
LAANPDVLKDDGSVDLSNAGTTPLMFPQDLSAALSYGSGYGSDSTTTASTPAATAAATAAASASSSPVASAGAANALSNGAISLSSPKILVGLMAALATFFAL